MKLSVLHGAALLTVAAPKVAWLHNTTNVRPAEGFPGCVIPPGYPIEKVYHPLINPTSQATFSELAAEWAKRAERESVARRGTYDAFGGTAVNYIQAKRWPQVPEDGGHVATIWYCYLNGDAKDNIQYEPEMAIQDFEKQMGGPPSATTGYGVRFREYTPDDGHTHPFCEDPDEVDHHGGRLWNPEIHTYDVVWVESRDVPDSEVQQYGTAGLLSYDEPHKPQPWLNKLRIDNSKVEDILHEMMHNLGMEHEFQRPDRDDWARVNYKIIPGYKEAYQACVNKYPGTTEDEFTSSYSKLAEFQTAGFGGFAFAKDIQEKGGRTTSNTPDLDSIMMYESFQYAPPGCGTEGTEKAAPVVVDKDKCPLLVYNKDYTALIPVVRCYPYIEPKPDPNQYYVLEPGKLSDGDKAWIKAEYPWGGR